MSALRDAIQHLINESIPLTIKRGKVESLNFSTDVCQIMPNDGTAVYQDVKLRSITLAPTASSSRMVVYPKLDSDVLFAIVQNNANDAFVIEVSEIDSILIAMGTDMEFRLNNDHSIDVKSPQTNFNGGSLGGLIKINDLVTKLNTVESSLNTLKTLFTSWAVLAGDGGAALKTIITAWAASPITTTTALMLEDTKVKH